MEDPAKFIRNLVRQKFKNIPDDMFSQVTVDEWFNILGIEDQLEIVEHVSSQGVDVPEFSLFHTSIPLDVWAYILKDSKNSTLRALCRTDKFFRKNCVKLVEKIGAFRQYGSDFKDGLESRSLGFMDIFLARNYPVEYLIAYESNKIMKDVIKANISENTPVNFAHFYFKNHKKDYELEILVESEDSEGTPKTTLIAKNEKTKIFLERLRHPFFFQKKLVTGGIWVSSGYPLKREFMRLLIEFDFDLWKITATEWGDTQIEYGGKVHVSRGPKQRKDVERITLCIACKSEKAAYFCGNMCTTVPIYCSQQCAQNDWNQHYQCK